MADGDNGQKSGAQPELIRLPSGAVVPKAELEQLVMMQAAQIASEVHSLYPLIDPAQLKTIALGTSRDQINLQSALESLSDPKYNAVSLVLEKQSRLIAGQAQRLSFLGPKRLEDATSLDEALKTATVYALLYCPSVRAMLALHGYTLKFVVGNATREAKAEKD